MKRLCVFCGSRPGNDARYCELAADLGRTLAQRGIGLVYGGGRVGMMGAIADAALAAGGEVIGVIPRALMARELGHRGISELKVVESMHDRKALMSDLADAVAALPGGIGTLDELFEAWTWTQLGIHRKPCGLLDAQGFFRPLVAFLDAQVEAGFLPLADRAMLAVAETPAALIDQLAEQQAKIRP